MKSLFFLYVVFLALLLLCVLQVGRVILEGGP